MLEALPYRKDDRTAADHREHRRFAPAARTRVESDAESYRLHIDLVVSEDGEERWHRTWERSFPRDHQ